MDNMWTNKPGEAPAKLYRTQQARVWLRPWEGDLPTSALDPGWGPWRTGHLPPLQQIPGSQVF